MAPSSGVIYNNTEKMFILPKQNEYYVSPLMKKNLMEVKALQILDSNILGLLSNKRNQVIMSAKLAYRHVKPQHCTSKLFLFFLSKLDQN